MIGPNLEPAVAINGSWLSITYAGTSDKGCRTRYRWTLIRNDLPDLTADDVSSGRGGGSLQAGLESLLSFICAFAESKDRESENGELFPEEMREWAEQNKDELSMLQSELAETPGLIDETV